MLAAGRRTYSEAGSTVGRAWTPVVSAEVGRPVDAGQAKAHPLVRAAVDMRTIELHTDESMVEQSGWSIQLGVGFSL